MFDIHVNELAPFRIDIDRFRLESNQFKSLGRDTEFVDLDNYVIKTLKEIVFNITCNIVSRPITYHNNNENYVFNKDDINCI